MNNLISNAYAQLRSCTLTMFGTAKALVCTVVNMRGAKTENIDVRYATPYGVGSFPSEGRLAIVTPMLGSNKSYAITGFIQALPDDVIPHAAVQGETWLFSEKYVLYVQNGAIKAYRVDDEAYNPTLPNGEYVGKILKDLITDSNVEMRDYINDQINAFLTTHTHTGVTPGGGTSGTSATPVTPITTNSTLATDSSDIDAGKYLIKDGGVMP